MGTYGSGRHSAKQMSDSRQATAFQLQTGAASLSARHARAWLQGSDAYAMRGEERFARLMATERRILRNTSRIERRISKKQCRSRRRHASLPDAGREVVLATQVERGVVPVDEGAPQPNPRALARLRKRLVQIEDDEGRRLYYVHEAPNGTALVVAPRNANPVVRSLPQLAHELCGAAAEVNPLSVPLLQACGDPLAVPLFGAHSFPGRVGDTLVVARRFVSSSGVPVHALCDGSPPAFAVHASWLGISTTGLRNLQTCAARLLGLKIRCEWALW